MQHNTFHGSLPALPTYRNEIPESEDEPIKVRRFPSAQNVLDFESVDDGIWSIASTPGTTQPQHGDEVNLTDIPDMSTSYVSSPSYSEISSVDEERVREVLMEEEHKRQEAKVMCSRIKELHSEGYFTVDDDEPYQYTGIQNLKAAFAFDRQLLESPPVAALNNEDIIQFRSYDSSPTPSIHDEFIPRATSSPILMERNINLIRH